MGRGLSSLQRDILGLAATIADFHGLPRDRGNPVREPGRWRFPDGRVREDAGVVDVSNPLVVHVVYRVPITDTYLRWLGDGRAITITHSRDAFLDGSHPKCHSGKVAVSKALGRLVERELLTLAINDPRGYLLTEEGYEVGRTNRFPLSDCPRLMAITSLLPFDECGDYLQQNTRGRASHRDIFEHARPETVLWGAEGPLS